jgi:hypothetical protein
MTRMTRLLAAGALWTATMAPALAQQGTSTFQQNQYQQQQQSQQAAPSQPRALFNLFGIPVVINAPVVAPYCNCASQIYGGQPVGGTNQPMADLALPP